MVTGWRRAFCTSIPKEKGTKVLSDNQQHCDNKTNQIPKISSKFGFFSNSSTPRLQSHPVSSPTLRCRTNCTATPPSSVPNSPKLQCNISSTPKKNNSPRLSQLSNPSSPKSPFFLFKSSLRHSKTRCGICLQSVKAGQGQAIFTAECSHTFHFPCITAHTKKQHVLACPVCSTKWNELPLLSFHHKLNNPQTEPNKPREPSKFGDVKTKPLRVYDDDEPLMSPTSGARFNPIPESDEEQGGENDNAGFQGFFVNPSTRFVDKSNKTIRNVDVRLLPDAAVVAIGKSYETYAVVLRVKAPSCGDTTSSLLDPASRAPIDLVTVLDVSSGMNETKLQIMKRSMRLLVSSLCSTDRLSIVAYSATSKRLLPLRRMSTTGRRSARRVIDAIVAVNQGSMCAKDAVKKATKVLEDRRERNPVATILLLSDGQEEKKSPLSPSVSSTRLPKLEIPVHTICFSHTPSEDAFIKRVGSLLSMVVQDLRLQLRFVSRSAPAEIAALYSLTAQPTAFGSGSIRIGDLYTEEERDFLVEIKVPSSSVGSRHVLSVQSSHSDPTTQELLNSKEQMILVPRPHTVRSSSPSIEGLRNLHVANRAVAESRRLIEHNDLSSAYHLVSTARALLQRSSLASAEEFVRGLDAEMAEINRRKQQQLLSQRQRTNRREQESGGVEDNTEPLTPTSAWRAAERLAKVAIMRKSMNRVSDLHGFENARF